MAAHARAHDGRRAGAVTMVADRGKPKLDTEAISRRAGVLAHCDLREPWPVRAAQCDRVHHYLRLRLIGCDGNLPDSRDGSTLRGLAANLQRAVRQRTSRN